jgi:iron uptake system component EfeO
MRRRGTALVALAAALALGASACGGDDFENEPRPPVPAEVSVTVDDRRVTVSPREFGAGIVNFTIANIGAVPTAVAIDGPTAGETEAIAPGNTAELRIEMETGDYEVEAPESDAEPFVLAVGPERESASDELLLP